MTSKIPHLSLAPPALESPSRFGARTALDASAGSPRSPRLRQRALRRAAWLAGLVAALALVAALFADGGLLHALAGQLRQAT